MNANDSVVNAHQLSEMLGKFLWRQQLRLSWKVAMLHEGCGACRISCLSPSCCAVTEYHSLGNLKKPIYWLMTLEAGKSKTEQPTTSMHHLAVSFHCGRAKGGQEQEGTELA